MDGVDHLIARDDPRGGNASFLFLSLFVGDHPFLLHHDVQRHTGAAALRRGGTGQERRQQHDQKAPTCPPWIFHFRNPPIFPDILPLPLRQGKTPLAVPAHGPTQKAALSRQSCLSVVSVFGEKPLIEAQKRPGICIRGRGKGSVNGHCRHRHRSLVVRPRGLASFSGSPVCPPRPGQ